MWEGWEQCVLRAWRVRQPDQQSGEGKVSRLDEGSGHQYQPYANEEEEGSQRALWVGVGGGVGWGNASKVEWGAGLVCGLDSGLGRSRHCRTCSRHSGGYVSQPANK